MVAPFADSIPLPSVCDAYQRLTGRDPRAIGKRVTATQIAVPCVSAQNHAHGDAHASLHIDTEKDVWICRVCNAGGEGAGGKSTALVVLHGTARDLSEASKWLCPPEPPKAPPPPVEQRRVTGRYSYSDEKGKLLYEVIRYEWDTPNGVDKTFTQRRALDDGSWSNRLDDVRRVPYLYRECIAMIAEARTIYVVEGEKKAQAMWDIGLPATTNAGGAGWGWTTDFVECFAGAPSIVVIGDNDDAGRAAAKKRAEMLVNVCGTVRLVESMPGVSHKGDVFDWIEQYRKANPEASNAQVAMKLKSALAPHAVLVGEDVDDGSTRVWNLATLHVRILTDQKPPTLGIEIGIPAIDRELYGLQPGETTILAARTGVGKTMVAEHMMVNAWRKHKVLVFSLEMGAKRLHDRLVSRAQNMGLKDYRMAGRPDECLDPEWYAEKKLFIVGKTRQATVERIIETIEIVRPDFVVVDHLRHVAGWNDTQGGKNRGDVVNGDIIDRLMQCATKMGHHNLLLSQTTREAEGKRPELSNLRDSGSVEEQADNVIMLFRPFKGFTGARDSATADDTIEVLLRKAREGGEVNAHMKLIPELMALEPLTEDNLAHHTRCCTA